MLLTSWESLLLTIIAAPTGNAGERGKQLLFMRACVLGSSFKQEERAAQVTVSRSNKLLQDRA